MITPTLTMAKLYEKQGEFTHALGVYQMLADKDKFARKKVKELDKKVFANTSLRYNPLILSIFSKEQLRNLNMLPDYEYKKLTFEQVEPEEIKETSAETSKGSSEEIASEETIPKETKVAPIEKSSTKQETLEDLPYELDVGISLDDFKKSYPELPYKVPPIENKEEVVPKKEQKANSKPTEETAKAKNFEEMNIAELLNEAGEKLDSGMKLNQITIGMLKKMLVL